MKKSVLAGVFLITLLIVVYAVTRMNPEPKEVATEEPDTQEEVAVTATCPETAPTVTIESSVNTLSHQVLLNGAVVGTIDMSEYPEAEAHVYRQTKCNVWIAASGTGRGGYILYGGDDRLYKLDLTNNTLARVNFDGFLTDLSADERLLVSVSSVDGPQGTVPSIEVTNVETGVHQQFAVPKPFETAGSAKFTPDGKTIFYAAVQRHSETLDPIKTAIYAIDLAAGTQVLTKANIADNITPYINGFDTNGSPIISDSM